MDPVSILSFTAPIVGRSLPALLGHPKIGAALEGTFFEDRFDRLERLIAASEKKNLTLARLALKEAFNHFTSHSGGDAATAANPDESMPVIVASHCAYGENWCSKQKIAEIVQKLKEAKDKAAEVFANTSLDPLLRMEALNIIVFCIRLIHHDDYGMCKRTWQVYLEEVEADRQFNSLFRNPSQGPFKRWNELKAMIIAIRLDNFISSHRQSATRSSDSVPSDRWIKFAPSMPNICLIYDCYDACLLPENRLCLVTNSNFSLRIVDCLGSTERIITSSAEHRFWAVAYNHFDSAILAFGEDGILYSVNQHSLLRTEFHSPFPVADVLTPKIAISREGVIYLAARHQFYVQTWHLDQQSGSGWQLTVVHSCRDALFANLLCFREERTEQEQEVNATVAISCYSRKFGLKVVRLKQPAVQQSSNTKSWDSRWWPSASCLTDDGRLALTSGSSVHSQELVILSANDWNTPVFRLWLSNDLPLASALLARQESVYVCFKTNQLNS